MATRVDYRAAPAARYARHRAESPAVVDELVRGGRVDASCRVLEVGCGTGNYTMALRRSTGAACVGIDPSPDMLAVARRRARHLRFFEAHAEALPFPDARFDLVFSVDAVHHLEDIESYFAEARRVLSPGGRISTVTEDEAMIRSRRISAYFPETVAVELARYPDVPRLTSALLAAGFGGVEARRLEWAFRVDGADDCRARAHSSLRLIPDAAFRRGLDRLERDLARGPLTATGRALALWARLP